MPRIRNLRLNNTFNASFVCCKRLGFFWLFLIMFYKFYVCQTAKSKRFNKNKILCSLYIWNSKFSVRNVIVRDGLPSYSIYQYNKFKLYILEEFLLRCYIYSKHWKRFNFWNTWLLIFIVFLACSTVQLS